jgi:hypothetical protein
VVRIDDLAEAALTGEAMALRSLAQDWLAQTKSIAACAPPGSTDPAARAVAAGLVELFAERRGEPPPDWTRGIAAVPQPIYLLRAARTMRRLRQLCEDESPLPLRRRNLLAPPTFLEFA